ncbi:MAG: nucleotidyltransferase family protein [Thainema sp.]
MPSTVAIILAAGASSRMGQCKALLPWLNGSTLLSYQIAQLQQSGVHPVVVLSPQTTANCDRVLAQFQRNAQNLTCVVNPEPARGKTSSILTGLHAIPIPWHTLIVSAVDQPRPAWFYQTLLNAHHQHTALITLPTFQGRSGHPVLFDATLQPELARIQEDSLGLRAVVQTMPPTYKKLTCKVRSRWLI